MLSLQAMGRKNIPGIKKELWPQRKVSLPVKHNQSMASLLLGNQACPTQILTLVTYT